MQIRTKVLECRVLSREPELQKKLRISLLFCWDRIVRILQALSMVLMVVGLVEQ